MLALFGDCSLNAPMKRLDNVIYGLVWLFLLVVIPVYIVLRLSVL